MNRQTRKFLAEFGHKAGILEIEIEAYSFSHATDEAHMTMRPLVANPHEWVLNGVRKVEND